MYPVSSKLVLVRTAGWFLFVNKTTAMAPWLPAFCFSPAISLVKFTFFRFKGVLWIVSFYLRLVILLQILYRSFDAGNFAVTGVQLKGSFHSGQGKCDYSYSSWQFPRFGLLQVGRSDFCLEEYCFSTSSLFVPHWIFKPYLNSMGELVKSISYSPWSLGYSNIYLLLWWQKQLIVNSSLLSLQTFPSK